MGDNKTENEREIGTGKYTFTGGFERACTCGHTLGGHTAARAKGADGKMYQECLEDCACLCFKPARKT